MRDFEMAELREALRFAAAGGQALHYHPFSGIGKVAPFREAGKRVAHLFDFDVVRLQETARSLKVFQFFAHHGGTPRQHLDLTGQPLALAARCCPSELDRLCRERNEEADPGRLTGRGFGWANTFRYLLKGRPVWVPLSLPDPAWTPPTFDPVTPGPEAKTWAWTVRGFHCTQEGERSIVPPRLLREIEATPLPKTHRRLPHKDHRYDPDKQPDGLVAVGFRTEADANTALAMALSCYPALVAAKVLDRYGDPVDGTWESMTRDEYARRVRAAFLRNPTPREFRGAGYNSDGGDDDGGRGERDPGHSGGGGGDGREDPGG